MQWNCFQAHCENGAGWQQTSIVIVLWIDWALIFPASNSSCLIVTAQPMLDHAARAILPSWPGAYSKQFGAIKCQPHQSLLDIIAPFDQERSSQKLGQVMTWLSKSVSGPWASGPCGMSHPESQCHQRNPGETPRRAPGGVSLWGSPRGVIASWGFP